MSNEASANIQQFEFKAEMKELLNLIVHSLYTHPEVFLRELVSNASDALNKVRFQRLTSTEILNPELELQIKITIDKENSTFSIEDTGIGMSYDDLINQIGTIASSGTKKLLASLKESKQKPEGNFIGQFGVGFYSVFMVTDEITIETRNSSPDSKAYKWVSNGQSNFTIEEIERENRGTKISFKLKDEHKEFAEDYRIKGILRKYSNFVDFPIFVNDEEVNKVQALWHRKKEDITDEEFNEFYKFISNDFSEPLGHLHFSIEGNINFKALLFVPKVAPVAMMRETSEKSVQLYSNKIFIQDDAKELLPEYLRFLKGVVDTEDLPLNVSREVTQSSHLMTKIRNVITGKVLTMLEEWADKDVEKYNEFFKNFGPLFKTGVNSDFSNKKRLVELLRFESSATKVNEFTSFNGYASRMKPEQNEIYFISGSYREQIEKNPNIEYFLKNNYEVLYLTDPVDIFTVPYIMDYDGKNIVSIDKANLNLDKSKEENEVVEAETTKSLIEKFKSVLGDKVEDVVESKRLVSSPVTLVVSSGGLDPQMEKIMQMMDKEFSASKRLMEINISHPLIKNLSSLIEHNKNEELQNKTIVQLYEGALLIEGIMKSPTEFVSRMNELLIFATKEN